MADCIRKPLDSGKMFINGFYHRISRPEGDEDGPVPLGMNTIEEHFEIDTGCSFPLIMEMDTFDADLINGYSKQRIQRIMPMEGEDEDFVVYYKNRSEYNELKDMLLSNGIELANKTGVKKLKVIKAYFQLNGIDGQERIQCITFKGASNIVGLTTVSALSKKDSKHVKIVIMAKEGEWCLCRKDSFEFPKDCKSITEKPGSC